MKKRKQILALAGVVLLGAMYLATLIFALIGTPWAFDLFKVCLGMTIIVPVLIYGYMMIYRILGGKGNNASLPDSDIHQNKNPDESH